MKRIVFILMLAAAMVLSGCGVTIDFGSNTVRGSGNVISETRSVSGFSQVVINGSGDAQITQTGTESLKIEAEDNILPLITSDVIGGKLVIGFKNNTSINTTQRIRFTITVKDLSGIEVNGSSDVNAGAVQTDTMGINVRGSGNIDLASLQANRLSVQDFGSGDISINGGKTSDQQVNISGSGTYAGPNLESQTASVTVSGSGDATLWAKQSLTASISGSGSLNYFGSPTVTQNVSGSGHINSRGTK